MENGNIKGYGLKYKLGEGGMAEVWYAENAQGVAVAIKMLHQRFVYEPQLVAQFENEARLMMQLHHPHIVQILEQGKIDGKPYVMMEFLKGTDLAKRLKNGQLFTNEQLINFWNSLVDALQYMHAKGVIHKDIKPANLFLTESGTLKLLDFGIAEIRKYETHTLPNSQTGTVMYMSPEQVFNIKNLTYKTDVYSLAVTFYQLVTGTPLYDRTTLSDFEIQESIVRKDLNTSFLSSPWQHLLPQFLQKDAGLRNELVKINASLIGLKSEAIVIDPEINNEEIPQPIPRIVKPDFKFSQQPKRHSSFNSLFPIAIILALIVFVLNKDKIVQFVQSLQAPSATEIKQTPAKPKAKKPVSTINKDTHIETPDTITSSGDDGRTDQVILNPDPVQKEEALKSFINEYYVSRNSCTNLTRFFSNEVLQYYNKSNVSLSTIERECKSYHDKWKFTDADIDDTSYEFTHNQNGKVYIDFTMLYYIKQNEADAWIPYKIDVAMVIDENNKIERIVERRIERL